MSESDTIEDNALIEPGLFTRLRPFAKWLLIAAVIVEIAWAVLSLVGLTA